MNITTIDSSSKKRIPFYNTSSSFVFSNGAKAYLRLDINKKQVIVDMSFQLDDSVGDDYGKIFHIIANLSVNNHLSNAQALSWNDICESSSGELNDNENTAFYNIPLMMMGNAIDRYQGLVPSFSEALGQNENDLLCRCFGVYKNQAIKYFSNIEANITQADFIKFTSKTKASLGCGSCKKDFLKIFKPFENSDLEGEGIGFRYYNNLTQTEFILIAEKFINKWLIDRQIEVQKVEIMDLYVNQLFCKVELEELEAYQLSFDFNKKYKVELIKYLLN